MILIVLAAGMGRRLGELTETMPKVLLTFPDGRSILQCLAMAAGQLGCFERMVIVCGHRAHDVEAAIADADRRITIRTEFNPFYAVSGPVISAWVARADMREADFVLCNGDTYYAPEAFSRALGRGGDGFSLGVELRATCEAGEMKVALTPEGLLLRVDRNLPANMIQGVSAGLLLVRGEASRDRLLGVVDALVRSGVGLKTTTPWHTIVNALIEGGAEVRAIPLRPEEWHEVDTIEDLVGIGEKLPKQIRSDGTPAARNRAE